MHGNETDPGTNLNVHEQQYAYRGIWCAFHELRNSGEVNETLNFVMSMAKIPEPFQKESQFALQIINGHNSKTNKANAMQHYRKL